MNKLGVSREKAWWGNWDFVLRGKRRMESKENQIWNGIFLKKKLKKKGKIWVVFCLGETKGQKKVESSLSWIKIICAANQDCWRTPSQTHAMNLDGFLFFCNYIFWEFILYYVFTYMNISCNKLLPFILINQKIIFVLRNHI